MAIILTLLKWLGIIILILLAVVLLALLVVLFVPFRYRAAARVDDPDTHSEFPLDVLRSRSDVRAEVTWPLGIVKVLASFPGDEVFSVRIFGKSIMSVKKTEKKEPEEKKEEEREEKEEKEEVPFDERVREAADRASRVFDIIDYVHRVLTGSCGRRALAKMQKCLVKILAHIAPSGGSFDGTVGLSDPCLNGRMTGANAILMTMLEDRFQVETLWEDYRCDLRGEFAGKIRIGVPLMYALPLVFDRDCRKLYKKLMKARVKFAALTPERTGPPAEIKEPADKEQKAA